MESDINHATCMDKIDILLEIKQKGCFWEASVVRGFVSILARLQPGRSVHPHPIDLYFTSNDHNYADARDNQGYSFVKPGNWWYYITSIRSAWLGNYYKLQNVLDDSSCRNHSTAKNECHSGRRTCWEITFRTDQEQFNERHLVQCPDARVENEIRINFIKECLTTFLPLLIHVSLKDDALAYVKKSDEKTRRSRGPCGMTE